MAGSAPRAFGRRFQSERPATNRRSNSDVRLTDVHPRELVDHSVGRTRADAVLHLTHAEFLSYPRVPHEMPLVNGVAVIDDEHCFWWSCAFIVHSRRHAAAAGRDRGPEDHRLY